MPREGLFPKGSGHMDYLLVVTMRSYPEKIWLYRGVGKEEADFISSNREIPASDRYGGVSHWTTDKDKARGYGDFLVSIKVKVDSNVSAVTGSSDDYPELEDRCIRKIGGDEYGIDGCPLRPDIVHVDRCHPGYRVGIPRVVETMNHQDGGRGTGYFGSGMYFYTDKKAMDESRHIVSGEQDGFKMDCLCKRPLKLSDDNAESLHKASRNLIWAVRKHPPRYSELDWSDDDELKKYYANEAKFNLGLILMGKNKAPDEKDILNAVEKTEACLKDAGTPWARTCTQPINHLLRDMGYDCVYPIGQYGSSNSFGAVAFKEDMEACLGRELNTFQDIELDDKFKSCFGLVD